MNSLRIAMMLESDGPGGAERVLLLLAEELRRRGHVVCHVGPDDGCGWLADQFRQRGFDTDTFTIRRPVDWRCLRGIVRVLRRRDIDVVHSHEFAMAVYGAAAAGLGRRSHIITMHGGDYYARRWWRRMALRWACRRSGSAIAVSVAMQNHLQGALRLGRGSITVVHNGVDLRVGLRESVRLELGMGPDAVLIVAVGSLYAVKGHIVLLRAAAELRTRSCAAPWRLAIAGRGEEEAALREFVAQHAMTDQVTFLGYRPDVPAILAAADIFAMPSMSEGLPLALLEAMHVGKAIVASDVGGIPEIVDSGRDGLLTPPGDHSTLTQALQQLIDDADYRTRLGEQARQRVNGNFSVERMTDRYEELYQAAVGSVQ